MTGIMLLRAMPHRDGTKERRKMPTTGPDVSTSSSAISGALGWIVDLLSGSLATAIAVLSVAMLGFAFLQGRLAVRQGTRVALGAFILFGAPTIAAALAGLAQLGQADTALPPPAPAASLDPVPPPPPPNPDPYAGASLPQ